MTAPTRSGVFLLASYPKSGNTWVRTMLESWHLGGGAIDINHLGYTESIVGQSLFSKLQDIEPGDLTIAEISRTRPAMQQLLADEVTDVEWFKSHDANLPGYHAETPTFPAGTLGGVVLLVRDPRDIAPSLAHHYGCSLDEAIDRMANERTILGRTGLQIPHRLSSWSLFQQSWLDGDFPLLCLRYEDLSADPAGHLAQILAFAGLPIEHGRIDRSVAATRFVVLRDQEQARGFRERLRGSSDAFFRRGQVGGWREELQISQAARILQDHGTVMARLGYAAAV